MILALLEIYPRPGKRREIIDILLSGQGQILEKPGCLGCDVTTGITDDKLIYIEKWESEKEFHRHLASEDYFRILNALEFASKPPSVSFFNVRDEKGLETIEQIRSVENAPDI